MSNLEVNANKIKEIIGYHKDAGTPMPCDQWPWNFLNSVLAQCSGGRKDLSLRQVEVLDDIKSKWGKAAFEKEGALNAAWQKKFDSDPRMKQRIQWVVDSFNAQALSDFNRIGPSRSYIRDYVFDNGYWSRVRLKWDKTGCISRDKYEHMVEGNVFSQRLIQAMEAPHKFEKGQLVCLRSGALREVSKGRFRYQFLESNWDTFVNRADTKGLANSAIPLVDAQVPDIPHELLHSKVPLPVMILSHDPVPTLSRAKGCRTYKVIATGPLSSILPTFIVEERWLKKAPKSK